MRLDSLYNLTDSLLIFWFFQFCSAVPLFSGIQLLGGCRASSTPGPSNSTTSHGRIKADSRPAATKLGKTPTATEESSTTMFSVPPL